MVHLKALLILFVFSLCSSRAVGWYKNQKSSGKQPKQKSQDGKHSKQKSSDLSIKRAKQKFSDQLTEQPEQDISDLSEEPDIAILPNAPIMICVVALKEDLYIEEWIRFNKLLGFDFIHVYDNGENASAVIVNLAVKYGSFLRHEHAPGVAVQVPTYNKCIETYRNQFVWAAFIDVDEFIVLHKHANIRAFVTDMAPRGGAIALSRVTFGHNNLTHYSPEPVMSRFLTRSARLNRYVKTIAYVPHVTNLTSPHYCHLVAGVEMRDTSGRVIAREKYKNTRGQEDIAAVYHYHTKSLEEYKVKLLRGDSNFPERFAQYNNGTHGEALIRHNFEVATADCTLVDMRAWNFYLKLNDQSKMVNQSE